MKNKRITQNMNQKEKAKYNNNKIHINTYSTFNAYFD